ncbi:MAG: gliding motility lipoprotein GldD [Bacteroidota bacterium]
MKISHVLWSVGAVAAFGLAAAVFWPDSTLVPKPKGYPRIEVPAGDGVALEAPVPFSFTHHPNANWETQQQAGWGDLVYPFCQGRVQFTYVPVRGNLAQLIDDAHELAMKHSVAADGMSQMVYVNDSLKVYGILFRIGGNAASGLQFYATDSTQHFVRGALYVFAHPNADSLAPVHQFFEGEFTRYLETLEWRGASGRP